MCAHFANIVCRCCLAHSLYVRLSIHFVCDYNKVYTWTTNWLLWRRTAHSTDVARDAHIVKQETNAYNSKDIPTYIRTHIQRHFVSSVSHAQTCKPFAMNTRGEIEQENEPHAARWSYLLSGATEFRISCCCCWYRPLTQLLATQQLGGSFSNRQKYKPLFEGAQYRYVLASLLLRLWFYLCTHLQCCQLLETKCDLI